jgi:hypothetical protein
MDDNHSDNYENDENEIIRSPDEVIVEQLVDSTEQTLPLSEEEETNMAILNSIQDFKVTQKEQDEYEALVLNDFQKMKEEREQKVKSIMNTLKKLARFDKQLAEILDLIDGIITAYCLGYIDNYELDTITYDKIFAELSTIRIDKSAIESFKEIIKREKL